MYELEGGWSVDVGYIVDVGTEMPTDPDHQGLHHGLQLVEHLGTSWDLAPALGRRAAEGAIDAARGGVASLGAFLSTTAAAAWWAARSGPVQAMICQALATAPGAYAA